MLILIARFKVSGLIYFFSFLFLFFFPAAVESGAQPRQMRRQALRYEFLSLLSKRFGCLSKQLTRIRLSNRYGEDNYPRRTREKTGSLILNYSLGRVCTSYLCRCFFRSINFTFGLEFPRWCWDFKEAAWPLWWWRLRWHPLIHIKGKQQQIQTEHSSSRLCLCLCFCCFQNYFH